LTYRHTHRPIDERKTKNEEEEEEEEIKRHREMKSRINKRDIPSVFIYHAQ
jgi:hypothetical protein